MDNNQLSGFAGRGQYRFFIPREDRPKVDDFRIYADFRKGFRRAFADRHRTAPADQGNILSGAGQTGFPDRDIMFRNIGRGGVGAVVDQALREEKDRRPARFRDGVQKSGGIGGGRRHKDVNPRHVCTDRFHGLCVIRAEARTVAAADRHDQHGGLPLAVGPPVHGADFGKNMVISHRQEVGKLHEGDRMAAGQSLTRRNPRIVFSANAAL